MHSIQFLIYRQGDLALPPGLGLALDSLGLGQGLRSGFTEHLENTKSKGVEKGRAGHRSVLRSSPRGREETSRYSSAVRKDSMEKVGLA